MTCEPWITLPSPPDWSRSEQRAFNALARSLASDAAAQLPARGTGPGIPADTRPSLAAAAGVLADLAGQGRAVRVDPAGPVQILPPAGAADPAAEKARVRRQELLKRDEQLAVPSVRRFVAEALEEVRRIEVGHGPRGLGVVPGDRYLLVSNSGSDTLSIVDLELNVELRQIPIGRDPRHMAITADGLSAFVCVWGEGVLAKVDVSALQDGEPGLVRIADTIDLGQTAHPYSAAIDPSGQRVWVANTQAPYASVVDISTSAVTRVELGAIGGRAVAFSPDRRFALISVETVSKVAVVRLDTLEVTRQIPVGGGPRGLTVDPDDDTLYVTNFLRNSVSSRLGHPEYGPNTLTVVDLASAPLDEDTGVFSYQPIEVGYGPCSVSILDISALPARTHEKRVSAAER